MRAHPIATENFLDSFAPFCQMLQAEGGSVYLFEQKTNVFVLNKAYGVSPDRFSISGDYEFIHYLKTQDSAVWRDEFLNATSHEMRQAALSYFQHTHALVCCPIREQGRWFGLIHLTGVNAFIHNTVFHAVVGLYADAVVRWLQYQRVTQQNRQFADVAHVKDQLLANVSHELNTPLNGVVGGCEALLSDSGLSEDQQRCMRMVCNSAKELQQTIDQILKLVQIEAKKNQGCRDKVDLNAIFVEVASLYEPVSREKNIQLHLPNRLEPLYALGHADQLRTVFINLLGNAMKFTEQGSVRLEVQKTVDWISVTVSDSGIGIDEDKQHLIFEEFYQADGSHTRVYGGTGLGLAIVKKIITLHGGKIWVESQKGAGTQFKFTLPVYPV